MIHRSSLTGFTTLSQSGPGSNDNEEWDVVISEFNVPYDKLESTSCIMVMIEGNGLGHTEFKTWTKLFAFHIGVIPLGKVGIQLFSPQLWVNSRIE